MSEYTADRDQASERSGNLSVRGGIARQLWFWVLIAIALGIAFGLAFPDTAEKAKWHGELDEERFHSALNEPETVDRRTEPALGGAVPA
jgi:hypothetical protein